ncbi:MAG: transcription elongation factor GreB [Nevskiaceae bacterium]|nr:MAG: transcription elongation factor GreB [Nevskiaceae bacterium]TBR74166.1 MAG: transcription elongation factor GreB [Nevskiaceae bacterium]
MTRYRAPQPPSAPFITAEGFAHLRAEYDELWHHRRPAVVRALSAAAAEGDRSENAEYIYRKKELREIDRRVGYLQRRLPELKVVDHQPDDPTRIFFGAKIEVDDGLATHGYRIVGPDEIDPERGWISIDSPLARALLKHGVGEVVTARLPNGPVELEVVSVAY